MDRLDELLTESRPHVGRVAALETVTAAVTRPRRKRGFVIAGIVTLSLTGATAAAATTGPLGDLIDYYLNGESNDHAWEMDITGTDGTQHCIGGIVVLPAPDRPGYSEADYLAIKNYVHQQDWSHLQPDPALLNPGQRGTAEELAITVDKSISRTALLASGLPLTSITTMGTAQCSPK